ncbi:MAG: DUF5684 domain-containing protein [Bacteroidales bacterium]
MDDLFAGVGTAGMIAYFVMCIVLIAAQWKIFEKAGKPGWASIVPIYNIIVFLEIVKKPTWWFILLLIPFVNIVIIAIVCIQLAKVFGKGTGFGIGLLLLSIVFFPILGFGDAVYQGTNNDNNPSQIGQE